MADKAKLKKEDILSWDYDRALAKLGKPVSMHAFTMTDISEFDIELLNFLPADSAIQVKELTFDANDEMYLTIPAHSQTDSSQLDDMYLTIWYTKKDGQWKPVHFMRYNKNSQF